MLIWYWYFSLTSITKNGCTFVYLLMTIVYYIKLKLDCLMATNIQLSKIIEFPNKNREKDELYY